VYSIFGCLNYGTYCSTGAPESFPPPEFHGKLQVGPGVDIWSFGCVLSEVATWLVYGTTGLEHYRTLRTKSHNVNFRDSDSFHDGLNVLTCVPAHHESLREALQRKGDTITQSILTLIDSSMLIPRDQRRDARDLWMMTFGHGSIFQPTPNTNSIPPSKPTPNINDILPSEPPEAFTNSLVIDTKHPFLLEPRKKSPSSAVSASIHESLQQDPNNSTTDFPLPEWPVRLLHQWRQCRGALPDGSLTHDLKDRDYVSLNMVSLATWLTLYSCSLSMIRRL
jgi:hypothetical protein